MVAKNSSPDRDLLRKYFAELVGTFALVFFGVGTAVFDSHWMGSVQDAWLGIAFAFGITLLVMVYAIGPISGCHINPAVTISMLTAGKISARDAIAYIFMQAAGAIVGAGVLYAIVSGLPGYDVVKDGLGQNGYGIHSPGGYPLASVLVAEIVLTFFFLLVIHGATSQKTSRRFAGIAIGLTLTAVHLVGIPIDGTSVNPARSLGPALFVGGDALSQLWVFLIAPVIGGILAALVWKYVLEAPQPAAARSD